MGEWVERDPGYLSFDVYNCTYCGKLIPRHIWFEEIEGQRQPFCNPDCHARLIRRRQPVQSMTSQKQGQQQS